MIVQLNTDNNVSGREELVQQVTELINDGLKNYSDRITRVEVHLADEDGSKNGRNDLRCTLEARLEGMQPIAVTNHSDDHQTSVSGAVRKLKTRLETVLGKAAGH